MATTTSIGNRKDAAVIWLHGLGDQGSSWSDLSHQFAAKYEDRVKFVYPDAPIAPVTCNGGMKMPSWFNLADLPLTADSREFSADVAKSIETVESLVSKLEIEGIPSTRIIIGGFSQGGALTLQTILRSRKNYAGGVILSGWLMMQGTIDDWLTDTNKKTPFFWGHGSNDPLVPVNLHISGTGLLRERGLVVQDKIYPGIPHSLAPNELDHVITFIAEKLGIEAK